MFATSKAVGFIRPGQRVLLRYQAYPYQKFGHYRGSIESVSRSALSPTEVPTQLAGLTSLLGTNEPIYRIVVRIERQSVNAYGVEQALQPGMQLESDVLLEWLNLDQTALTDNGLSALKEMKSLTFLHLGSTQITAAGAPSLFHLKSLKDLKLTRTALAASNSAVAELHTNLPLTAIQTEYVEGE